MSIKKYNDYSAKQGKLIYLAVPYTAHDAGVQMMRYTAVTVMSARLAEHGIDNLSPITSSHNQQNAIRMPHTWDFWERHDLNLLKRCDEIWVLTIEGWKESKGVQGELEAAKEFGLPIRYIYINQGQLGCTGEILILDEEPGVHSCLI